ncbi:MAG: hypothetical protein Q8P02_04005 [Candidatus Micrarchaeota archaeon]|nr:hypothetical protein [Candidatus Micrarchaeota archaeon]
MVKILQNHRFSFLVNAVCQDKRAVYVYAVEAVHGSPERLEMMRVLKDSPDFLLHLL